MLQLEHDQPASHIPLSTQPASSQEGGTRPDIEKNESGLLPEFQDALFLCAFRGMLSPHRSGPFMGVGGIPTESFEPTREHALALIPTTCI